MQDSKTRSYAYTYDGLNRLLNAAYTGDGNYATNYSYDKMGNIISLQRYDVSLVDNLTYTYNGNQLTKVEDATANTFGFKNGSSTTTEYFYDNNGNLTKDLNKNITNISYNSLNLPSVVTFSNGSTITYTYAADGRKLRTVHVIDGDTTTTDYCGNVIYENGIQKRLLTEVGYVDLSDNSYHFYIKDHLGNNRVVADSNGNIEESNQYYPFGLSYANANSNLQPYKYNGKELDTKGGLNWYDYGARHYDAALGRWLVVDPLSEKYYPTSPYAFTGNNTVNAVEIGGGLFVFVNGFYPMEYMKNWGFRLFRGISYPCIPELMYNPDRSFQNTDFYDWANIDQLYMNQYNDRNSLYVNGSFGLFSSASERFDEGVRSGEKLIDKLRSGECTLADDETIKIVGYSMGGAYAAGMAHALMQDSNYAHLLQLVDYLAPYQPSEFKHPKGVLGRQFVSSNDWIATDFQIENVTIEKGNFGQIGHSLGTDFYNFLLECLDNGAAVNIIY